MRIQGKIERTVAVHRSARVIQLEGKFDLAPLKTESAVWDVDVTLPEKWNVGVIVGSSGNGKTSVARLIAEKLGAVLQTPRDEKGVLVEPYVWGADAAVIEEIAGEDGDVEDAIMLMTSVGFGSPPAWRRPFRVLSIGQQFRATLARALAEAIADKKPRMVDEYAGPLDRVVAQYGSAAVQKAVRTYDLQLVAVTPHEHVVPYLDPDWVITVHEDKTVTIEFSEEKSAHHPKGDEVKNEVVPARRWVRPRVELRLARASHESWARFGPHHYLNHELSRASMPFVAELDGVAVGFVAAMHYPQQKYGLIYREHRVVVLPDYQGMGIGNRISEAIAAMFKATGKPYFSTTSHPAMIAHRKRSPLWRMTARGVGTSNGATGLVKQDGKRRRTSANRLSASFEFMGPADERNAGRLGVLRMCKERGKGASGLAAARAR
jgi:ABC-type dipeptide/oligopeptide/nickel transport system ATPase subunit/GNAT superfamily N-acetyltransferase